MTQVEQFEFVCRKCGRKDILESEPPLDYECYACDTPANPEYYEKTHPDKVKVSTVAAPNHWRCNKHQQTFRIRHKRKETCLECEKEQTKPLVTTINPSKSLAKKFQDDLESVSIERERYKELREHQKAVYQAPLNTLEILEKFTERQDRRDELLLKTLEQLIKMMGDKNATG